MVKPAFSIYDASAGSGKTYTLVKEYLKIILLSKKPDAYRNILAITFTNKAVHEMKSRVIDSLSEFANENPSEKIQKLMETIASETHLSLNDIHSKAKSIIKNLIHNYAAFDISTIDKFTHKVIRAFAHDLKLPITFEVSLDTEALLTEAVDAIIALAGDDEEITKLLVDYTLEKTNDDKSWDVSREIMETGKLILNENNREELIHFQEKKIADFVLIKSKLIELCKELDDQCVGLASQAIDLLNENNINLISFSSGYFPNHLLSIKDGRFNPKNKTYHEFDDIKINKNASDKSLIENLIPQLLAMLNSIYTMNHKKSFYEAFLKNITPLSLLNTLSNKLSEIQKEKNILSIAEFNKLINDQIQNQPAPFIYERLGEKYKHFFIDEFQDTSVMQWQNLIPLIDNSLSSEDLDGTRGSLLIVGDPKQSIYRWRGGKAEQFIELSKNKNPFVTKNKKVESLDTNYRSYSEIIHFNNHFFSFLSNKFANDDYKDLYLNHSFQKENDKKGGFVSLSFIPKTTTNESEEDNENQDKDSLYLNEIIATIERVRELGFFYKDIVILSRNNKKAMLAAQFLTEHSIPIVSSESLLLSMSSEVLAIIHTLRYMNNRNDLEAKSNMLYYLAKNQQDEMAIHDCIAQGMDCKNEEEFQDWLLINTTPLDFQILRKKSLYEATEMIISKLIPVSKRSAYVQFFLDVILEKDVKNQMGISEFLQFWDDKSDSLSIPSPEGNDAVKIMTIHKSKGLEFPVVIFPFAEENYTLNKQDRLWIDTDETEIGLPKVLVAKNKNVASFSEEASVLYEQKEQENLLDNINVIYVALTRAEEQLYIISSEMQPNKDGNYPNNLASFFVEYLQFIGQFIENQLQFEFGNNKRISIQSNVQKLTKTPPQRYSEMNPKSIKIAQKESLMWNTKQQHAIEYGNLLHEILSYVKTQNDIDNAIIKAIENGLIVVFQKESILKSINKIVLHPELKDYFAEENKVINEKTIIQKDFGLTKPDRIVFTPKNEVLLLDYKTGEALPKHKSQIENYQSILEEMGYKVVKKALIYIGEEIKIIHL